MTYVPPNTLEDEGVNLTQRSTVDFQGAGVTATDNGSKTIVKIPGGIGGMINVQNNSLSADTPLTTYPTFVTLATVTVDATDVLIFGHVSGVIGSAGGTVHLQVTIDGTPSSTAGSYVECVNAGSGFSGECTTRITNLSSGLHTYRLQAAYSGPGTGYAVNASSDGTKQGASLLVLPTSSSLGSPAGFANYVTATDSSVRNIASSSFTEFAAPQVTITTKGGPVLLLVNSCYNPTVSSAYAFFTIYRNHSVNLGGSSGGLMTCDSGGANSHNSNASMSFVDVVPAGTYTYSIAARNGAGTGQINENGEITSIAALELLGPQGGVLSRLTATDSSTNLYYPLDETASPWANNGVSGTLNLTNVYGSPYVVTGLFGQCLDFVGGSGIASADTSVAEVPNNWTASCWVNLRSYTQNGILMGKKYQTGSTWSNPFVAFDISLGSTLSGIWTASVTISGARYIITADTPYRIPLGEWCHIASTFDGTTFSAYLNGNLVGTNATMPVSSSTDWGSHGPWIVGAASNVNQQAVDGRIDEVRFESTVRSKAYLVSLYRNALSRQDTVGAGYGYTQIQDEGVSLTQRNTIDFQGAGVTATDNGSKTIVTIPGGGGSSFYQTFQDEGVSLTQRSIVNFVGSGVTATDNGTNTVVTVPGYNAQIQNSGSNLTQRTTVNFTGAGVAATDNGTNTVITIPGYNSQIQNSGSNVTQRTNVNFTGAGVTVSDTGSLTQVSIPGSVVVKEDGTTIGTRHTIDFTGGGVLVTEDVSNDKVLVSIPSVTLDGPQTGMYTVGAVASTSVLTSSARRVDPDTNTLVCWTFNESASPYANSGSGGTLNLTTSSGTPSAVTGLFGNALGLSNAIVTTGNTSAIEPNYPITVSAWVHPRSFPTSFNQIILKEYRNNNTYTSPFATIDMCLTNVGDGSWTVSIITGSGVSTGISSISGAYRLRAGDWNHVALTYDGTTLKAYLNGNLAASTSVSGNLDYGTHGAWDIGGVVAAGTGQQWDGWIEDVRIENVVRSANYLEDLYRKATGFTNSTVSATLTGAMPASDSNTLLDFWFQEKVKGVLVNHGSYGTASSPLGPVPTTTTASFVQPAVGSTVAISVTSGTGYQAGQLILVGSRGASGAGGNYYYLTAVSGTTLTAKNLGVSSGTGSAYTSVGGTIASGSAVSVNLDLLFNGNSNYVSLTNLGPFGYCHGFNGSNASNWYNYGNNISGGCPDFNGITKFSMHLLLNPGKYNNTFMQWFGYAHSQVWTSGFTDIVMASDNGNTGFWNGGGANQTFTVTAAQAQGAGYFSPGVWQLLSFTADLTQTTSALNIYKNGFLVGTGSISATGSLAFGSAGYWFLGNPGPGNGDTGDNYQGMMALARFENVVRSQSYIQRMWQSIMPQVASW